MTKEERKVDYVQRIIPPHRLGEVDIMHYALTQMTFEDGPKSMELYVNGKLKMTGRTTAFRNPAIEAGIIHARAMLEFLGLQVDPNNPTRLKERNRKQHSDDLFVEDFTNGTKRLSKITYRGC